MSAYWKMHLNFKKLVSRAYLSKFFREGLGSNPTGGQNHQLGEVLHIAKCTLGEVCIFWYAAKIRFSCTQITYLDKVCILQNAPWVKCCILQ